MLTLTQAQFATTEQLFRYKSEGFTLDPFPGYTVDQWGIKAHNRPWIAEHGRFAAGQRIIEVGGGYSTLPKYLARKYDLEAWIGDDFGATTKEEMWSRWGKPKNLPAKNQDIKYVFVPFGIFSSEYPDDFFHRIFSVSTLEHIPRRDRLNVLKDMNRCLKSRGMQLHTIDIATSFKRIAVHSLTDYVPFISACNAAAKFVSETRQWLALFRESGIRMACRIPRTWKLFNRSVLVESPDVVYRYCPPNNEPKRYSPNASLLLVIEDL